MQAAAIRLPVVPGARGVGDCGRAAARRSPARRRSRFLFEEVEALDGRSAVLAIAASALLHLPLLAVAGMLAPSAGDRPRYRDVTAILDSLAEAERLVPVDLAALGPGEPSTATPAGGPAPGVPSLLANPAAHGSVSMDAPAQRREATDPGLLAFDTRISPPEEIVRGGKGGSGLSPEEEREMSRKWFLWYRHVLGRKIYSTYPRRRLEEKGVRGSLAFRLELAPDGEVRSCKVTRADSPLMEAALKQTIEAIGHFPGFEATGLSFFPPFVFSILHGETKWQTVSAAM